MSCHSPISSAVQLELISSLCSNFISSIVFISPFSLSLYFIYFVTSFFFIYTYIMIRTVYKGIILIYCVLVGIRLRYFVDPCFGFIYGSFFFKFGYYNLFIIADWQPIFFENVVIYLIRSVFFII